MKIRLLFVAFILFNASPLAAQLNHYYSITGSVNFNIIHMKNRMSTVDSPTKMYVGGGLAYGFSIVDQFNMSIGLDYLSYKPYNPRGFYDTFDEIAGENEMIYSYKPDVSTSQIYLPIGFEFYSNTNYKPFHTFLIVSFIPSFSLTEKMDVTVYDELLNEIDHFSEEESGFKFQDFNVSFAISNDLNILEKYKFFFEPSVRISALFRSEDLINPGSMFLLKVGIRYRGEHVK